MIKEVTAMTARKNFGELLNEVKYCHDNVLITKAGKPLAALIDIELFEKIRHMRHQFDTLTDKMGKAYEGIDPEIAEQEIQETFNNIRGEGNLK
ncbi:MAG: type II toxin-antitoxin system prevent-host-death family antitoxin [Proteobacteria bacterium]|nr:type II toxin-antitoxin system prevent-host-death family antitoxin [Pseudomonadota bacterium]